MDFIVNNFTHLRDQCLKKISTLLINYLQAQEPRKRLSHLSFDEPTLLEQTDEDVSCSVNSCVKRSPGQDEFGPFWANRGKKDPTYARSKLFAEEPHWILVRRDDKDFNDNEPFYITRGKKRATQLWKNFFGTDLPRKIQFLQNTKDVPIYFEATKKANANNDKSADFP